MLARQRRSPLLPPIVWLRVWGSNSPNHWLTVRSLHHAWISRNRISVGYVLPLAPTWAYNSVATFAYSSVWIIIPDSAYVCANGLLDTGSLSCNQTLTSRSKNGNWHRRRESNSPKSDRQSVALPENYCGIIWYSEWDSNPHLLGHNVLNVAGLPIPCTRAYWYCRRVSIPLLHLERVAS